MNYLSIYNSIITNSLNSGRRKRKHTDPNYVYYERHHIIPKCVGGTDDIGNLVLLTAREHFVAHQLLTKIYPEEHKLVFALRMLCRNNNKNHIRNNKEYNWIKESVAKTSSISQKGKPGTGNKYQKGHILSIGENNGMHGKVHSRETRDKMSEKAQERDSAYYDFLRVPKTKETKDKLSLSHRKQNYKLISPDGKEYTFDTAKDASLFSGVSTSVIVKLAGNRYGFDHCRNWKVQSVNLP